MDLLLDTHVFLWWQAEAPQLGEGVREKIRRPTNRIFVSVVTIWEIGLKRSLGKLPLQGSVREAIARNRFEVLDITAADAERVETLPWHHRDPFDRMLIAQAIERDLTLATADHAFSAYAVPLLAGSS